MTDEEMQCRFNRGRYWKRMLRDEFRPEMASKGNFRTMAFQRRCGKLGPEENVWSQMVSYIDTDDVEIARVHQYCRVDKRPADRAAKALTRALCLKSRDLAASGKPDPKFLFHNNVFYIAVKVERGRMFDLGTWSGRIQYCVKKASIFCQCWVVGPEA